MVDQQVVDSFAGHSDDELDATAIVRAYCNWHIAGVLDEVRDLDSQGGSVLLLPTTHLVDVGEVTARATATPITDVDWSEKGIISIAGGLSWPVGLRAVTVNFSHGFADVPREIAAVTRSLSRRQAANPTGALSVTKQIGTGSITRVFGRDTTPHMVAAAFTGMERMVLDRYRVTVGAP